MAFGIDVCLETGRLNVVAKKQRPIRPKDDATLQALEKYADSPPMRDALGYYWMMAEWDREVGKTETSEEIEWFIRMGKQHQSIPLLLKAASWLSMYSVHYCYTSLGEDKSVPLRKEISVLEEAIKIAPYAVDLHLRLAESYLSRPQTRDCCQARQILEAIVSTHDLAESERERLNKLMTVLEKWERKSRGTLRK